MDFHNFTSSVNEKFENFFFKIGVLCAKHSYLILLIVFLTSILFGIGIVGISFENDVYKLWIEDDSRLQNERAFIDKYFGLERTRTSFTMAIDKKNNILTSKNLEEWLRLAKVVTQEVSVTFDGKDYKWNDVCDRIPNPFIDLPCSKYTLLDCFQEGGFDFFLPPLPGLPPNPYPSKPSFQNKTSSEISDIVKNSCSDWSGAPIPENFMMGGVTRNENKDIVDVRSFQFVFNLRSFKSMAQRMFSVATPTAEQIKSAEALILSWENSFVEQMKVQKNSLFGIHFWAKRTEKDLMNDAMYGDGPLMIGGYILMVLCVAIVFFRIDFIKSRILAGSVGVLLVCISVFASLGISAILGVTFTPLHLQVLPFLALGIGVDDMFVLAFSFKVKKNKDIFEASGNCLKEAGLSVTLTSLVNSIAFFICATNPLPNVSLFCISAGITVVTNYFVVLFGFTAVLCLDAERMINSRSDCIPCITLPSKQIDVSDADPSIASSSKSKIALNEQEIEKENEEKTVNIGYIFGKLMMTPAMKIFSALLLIMFIVLSIIGINNIEIGLPLAEIVPKDHFSSAFLKGRESYYTDYEASIMTGMKSNGELELIDYPTKVGELMQIEKEFQKVSKVNPNVPIPWISWVDNFVLYVYQNHPQNMTAFGTPDPSAFYPLLYQWLQSATGVSFSNRIRFGNDGKILTSSIRYFQTDIRNSDDMVRHITDSRKMLDSQSLPMFPEGFIYNFYERYIRVKEHLRDGLIYAGISIGFVSICFLLNPLASIIMLLVISIIILISVGFLSFLNLNLNEVSTINIIVAVGISVEFTAHIIRSFMTSKGKTRDERVIKSFDSMFIPVTAGGLSTILGVSAMAFATFPYYQQYFFQMFVLIILSGWISGIFFLPLILSFIGPDSLVSQNNRSRESLSMKIMVSKTKNKEERTEEKAANENGKNLMTGILPQNTSSNPSSPMTPVQRRLSDN